MEPGSVFHETPECIVRNMQERRTKLTQVLRLGAYCTKPLIVLYENTKNMVQNP